MPANQQAAIRPFVVDQRLKIRRKMTVPGSATTAKIEVRDPQIENDEDEAAWRSNPTGPLVSAAQIAMPNAPHQVRIIFELGRAAEVFFSDRVLIGEGKTESRLLPFAYDGLRGRTMRADRCGLVSVDGSSNIVAAMRTLREMRIEAKAVADLDFAFKVAPGQGLLNASDPDLAAAIPILARLSPVENFLLDPSGLPKKGGTLTTAEAWGVFAADPDGKVIALSLHSRKRCSQRCLRTSPPRSSHFLNFVKSFSTSYTPSSPATSAAVARSASPTHLST